jgi:hypothetical protein
MITGGNPEIYSHMKRNKSLSFTARTILALILTIAINDQVEAQAELAPWGNLMGIRMEGQLMEFETGVAVAKADWSFLRTTCKEKQRPHYARQGVKQTVQTSIDSLYFSIAVKDISAGTAALDLRVNAHDEVEDDIYFSIGIPEKYYSTGYLQADKNKRISLASDADVMGKYLKNKVNAIHFLSDKRQLTISFAGATPVVVRKVSGKLTFYIPVHTGKFPKDGFAEKSMTIKTSGVIDRSQVALQIDTEKEGREFIGFGGNFRLQNPRADPQVIDYCLENLRVAFGRVEMPWRFWQPGKTDAPIDSAKNGRLHPAVEKAMLMAQRLSKKGIPVILSAWSAPSWAIKGPPKFGPGPDGVWGNPLEQNSMKEIYKSIGDYIICLRDQYGVNISYFSFNESDLGINIRQTGEEHASLIKGLGAYLEQVGLKTKMLLGDNSDATTYEFIYPAMKDPATHPYIGAVSFHSWRGWDKETLQKWADAATQLKLPLLVAEGSIDAQAWGYPAIFEEPVYAREEINLYTRLLSICQPAAILQWQLTSDYSPLSGGGVFGNYTDSLHPTQRFWNLKQLASTPAGLKALGAVSDNELVTVAALGDRSKGIYSIHIVNNGPGRKTVLSGFPGSLRSLRIFITDKQRAMKEGKKILLKNGTATFTAEAGTYTTLSSQ